ncbi:MAG: hypothetical protein ABSE93_04465 [Terriglobia bacterium]|jgi:hypothetical protein
MGRNKELRKRIAAQREVIEDHEEKIRREWMKAMPNESYIRGWSREISTATEKIEDLVRRLKREW